MTLAVGIDLGTSNSAVAVLDPSGRPRIITTAEGGTTLPSLVWFSPRGPLVGEAALPGLAEEPGQTVASAKRLLGRAITHPAVQHLATVSPYGIVASPRGEAWIALADGRRVAPEYVAALILGELRRMAESALGGTVSEAVITVPAWYDSAQRHAVRDAASIAGLAVRRLLSEPTAAALGHGAHLGRGGRHLICDLGGGTFDVSVVDIDGGVFEVLATAGDALLGGDDFDAAAVAEIAADVRARFGVELTDEPARLDRVRHAAQRAKHELSAAAATSFFEAGLAPLPTGRLLDYARPIARAELEAWTAPLLARLDGPCRDALRRAQCAPDEVDEILLVGGMTRMPAVQARLGQVLGRAPRQVDNPDEVVAVGAAIAVARLAGDIEGVLLIDACPRGVALSYDGGPCEVVIPPGVVVPIREARVLPTRRAGQRALEFDVWEGESADPSQNRHLARYVVTDVPEAAAGDAMIVVELTVDTDGVVGVTVRELISGERPPLGALVSIGMPRAEMEALRAQLGTDLAATAG